MDNPGKVAQGLSADFEELLKSGDSSDVTLMADGKELQAHQLILSTRSPVFAAMFKIVFKDKQYGVIGITYFAADVLQELLHFIYTDKVNSMDQFALELLAAADKVFII